MWNTNARRQRRRRWWKQVDDRNVSDDDNLMAPRYIIRTMYPPIIDQMQAKKYANNQQYVKTLLILFLVSEHQLEEQLYEVVKLITKAYTKDVDLSLEEFKLFRNYVKTV